jgi:hypothetical protein
MGVGTNALFTTQAVYDANPNWVLTMYIISRTIPAEEKTERLIHGVRLNHGSNKIRISSDCEAVGD